MGTQQNIKKFRIPLNKKLNNIITNIIKSDNVKIQHLIQKNTKKIKSSNFSQKFNQNDNGIKNIYSLINLIYVKNANSCLKIQSNITIYEAIFNADINPNNNIINDSNEINKIESSNEDISNFENDLNESMKNYNNYDMDKIENDNQYNSNIDNNYYNYSNQSTFSKLNLIKKNEDNNITKVIPKKKKHNKKPKIEPVANIKIDLSEIYKEILIEKHYSLKKKDNKKKKNLTKQKKNIDIQSITKNGIQPTNVNDGSFLEIIDIISKQNK